jgi:hypothetical protein
VSTQAGFRVSACLRWLGAALLFGAATTFLVQGWSEVGVLGRELSWAGLTLALTLFGIFAVRKLDDAKGARVGLGLAAATIPLHFAEVGGGIWSYRDGGLGSLPALGAAALVLAALAPMLGLGVAALVRRRGALLTGCLYLLSAALLVPTRNGDAISAMVLVELAMLLGFEVLVARSDVRLQTREGIAARCLLWVPVLVLLLRHANYPATDLWLAMLLFLPSAVAAALPFVGGLKGRVAMCLESAGVLGLAVSLLVAFPVTAFSCVVSSAALAVSALFFRQSGALFGWCGVAVLAACSVVAWDNPDVGLVLAIVPAGFVHAAVAFHRRSLGRLGLAILSTAIGLVGQFTLHVRWPAQNAWMLAAGVGVLLLVVASLVESKRSELERLWAHLSRHFAEES